MPTRKFLFANSSIDWGTPNFQTIKVSVHTTYPANFIETTDMVQKMQQFKLYISLFK